MNYAAELLVHSLGMIFFIVIVSELAWKLLSRFGGDK